jgi:hypothetical protein
MPVACAARWLVGRPPAQVCSAGCFNAVLPGVCACYPARRSQVRPAGSSDGYSELLLTSCNSQSAAKSGCAVQTMKVNLSTICDTRQCGSAYMRTFDLQCPADGNAGERKLNAAASWLLPPAAVCCKILQIDIGRPDEGVPISLASCGHRKCRSRNATPPIRRKQNEISCCGRSEMSQTLSS